MSLSLKRVAKRYWLVLPRVIGFGFQHVVADTGATPTPNEDEVGRDGDLPWWREDRGEPGGGWRSNLKYTETQKGVQELELHKRASIYTQADSHGQAAATVRAVTTNLREHNRSRCLLSQTYEWSIEGHEGLHEGEQGTCVLVSNSKRTRRRNIAGSCESRKVLGFRFWGKPSYWHWHTMIVDSSSSIINNKINSSYFKFSKPRSNMMLQSKSKPAKPESFF
ncbi:hypothetical protein EDB85DRAFT_1889347 [Lactarius pseudohatsudake]|nr:hypothetical protein EDB85DRAFT_1889347 [Lactarius pseudohatsudake]